MASNQMVNFQLSVIAPEASDDELNAVVRAVAAELEEQGADVAAVANPRSGPGRVAKGDGSVGSILKAEINLENIVAFGKWLKTRLVGTTTKVKFVHNNGTTFEFDGRDEVPLADAMAEFKKFVETIDQSDDKSGQA